MYCGHKRSSRCLINCIKRCRPSRTYLTSQDSSNQFSCYVFIYLRGCYDNLGMYVIKDLFNISVTFLTIKL
ncbi:hypothetical protein CR513_62101, partial [Mucuna pruriens]